jgi:glycosyltransferase involved in cell wall biosynthesis
MKILHVNWSGALGGAENFALRLAKSQRDAGHDITLMYMSKSYPIGKQAISSGINIIECNMKNGYDFANFAKFIHFIKKGKYDVIHNHNGAPILNLAKIFSHSSIFINHNHGTRFRNGKQRKLNILLWNKFTYNLFDHHIANSESTKKIILSNYQILANKMSVLYNGIQLDNFRPTRDKMSIKKEFGLSNTDKIVGIIARLVPAKGVDKFVEVAAQVTKVLINARFFVVGDGESRVELEEKVTKLNLRTKVVFTGARTDIANLLSIFDVFLLTSNWEAFGMVLLEAMAIGVPIVAFAVDAISEVVNNSCAILVNPGEIETMSQSVIDLLKNKSNQDKLIRAGFKRVKKFDIKWIAAKSIDIYKSLLRRKYVRH